MCDDVDGFWTHDTLPVCEAVREAYPKEIDLCRKINRFAVAVQYEVGAAAEDTAKLYALGLYARTLATTQAAFHLLERGMLSQSRMLMRCALEALFVLGTVAKDPAIVDRILDGHRAVQQDVAKAVARWKSDALREIAVKPEVAALAAGDYGSPTSALSTFDYAFKAGLEDWYHTVYKSFSWTVHVAPSDIENHLVLDANGVVTALKNESELNGLGRAWLCGCEVLLKATEFLGLMTSLSDVQAITGFHDEKHSLFSVLLNEAA